MLASGSNPYKITAYFQLLLLWSVILLTLGATTAVSAKSIELSKLDSSQAIGEYLQYLEDPSHQLTLAKINQLPHQWQTSESKRPNFGIDSSTFWFKLEINNDSEEAKYLLLELANSRVSNTEYYQYVSSGESPLLVNKLQQNIDDYISERYKPHRHFIFPVNIRANEKATIYLKVRSAYPLKLPLYLRTVDQFHTADTNRMLFQGFYFGCVAIMVLYNLFIYFMVKDRSYLLYSTFMLALATLLAIDKGLTFQFVWPNSPQWNQTSFAFFIAVAAAMSVLFTIEFLSLKKNSPNFFRFFQYLFFTWAALAISSLFTDSSWIIVLEVMVVLPGGTALFLAGIFMWRKGVPAAPYYTIAWVFIIQGATVYALSIVGLFPDNLFSEYAFQSTNIIEATLLSLGLAYRIKILDREKERATASEKAKNEFLANMSHEIRTPMNGVLGMAQLMEETTLSPQQKSYLSTILSSGNALLNILNDILDHSKIEAGKLEIENIQFSLRKTLEEAASIFALKAANNHLSYHLWISPDVPSTVNGDPTRVRQILCNYLSNAFKFTTQGEVLIRCYVTEMHGEDSIVIEVQDSGLGIPKNLQTKLFSSFTQASSSTARQFGGTGLGLSICKSLAELMHGSVGMRSEEGKGSCFWFTLPSYSESPPLTSQKQDQLRSCAVKLVTSSATVQEAFIEYQTAYQYQLQVETSLPDQTKGWDSLLKSPCDKIFIDLSPLPQSDLINALNTINDSDNISAEVALLVKPGLTEEQFKTSSAKVSLLELPLSIEEYMQGLLREEHRVNVEHVIELELNDVQGEILVVEDNIVNQKVVAGFLKKCGLSSHIVATGEAAIEFIKTHNPPDLILMDCNLPGMDGYETTRHIRQIIPPEHAPIIIALSAHAFEEHRNLCIASGMNDHLSKPLIFNDLKKVLLTYLNNNLKPNMSHTA